MNHLVKAVKFKFRLIVTLINCRFFNYYFSHKSDSDLKNVTDGRHCVYLLSVVLVLSIQSLLQAATDVREW